MLYTYPKFVRQSGMGNRLFPWARAYLFAKDHGARIIWPTWPHLRRGPLLKGGVNSIDFFGKIFLFGNFTPDHSYVCGFRKQVLLKTSKLLSEADIGQIEKTASRSSQVLVFEGYRDLFASLAGRQLELKAALTSIASPKVVSELQRNLPPIALNIRRGRDFRDPRDPREFETTGSLRTPLEWFILTLQRIRNLMGNDIGAYVVSDGDKTDLKPVLSLPNTMHVKNTTALADLLSLAQARLLIASGGSSFSAWGAFLSAAPTLCIPGQSLTWFGLRQDRVGVFDPRESRNDELYRYCAGL
jgi:hypothetical protein